MTSTINTEQFYDVNKNLVILMEEAAEVTEALIPFLTKTEIQHIHMDNLEDEVRDLLAMLALVIPTELYDLKADMRSKYVQYVKREKDGTTLTRDYVVVCLELVRSLSKLNRIASKCYRFGLYSVWPKDQPNRLTALCTHTQEVVELIVQLEESDVIISINALDRIPEKYERLAKHYHGYGTGENA